MSPTQPFTCSSCGSTFTLSKTTTQQYPGWVPSLCPRCFSQQNPSRPGQAQARKPAQQALLSVRPPQLDSGTGAEPGTASAAVNFQLQPTKDPILKAALQEVLQQYHEGPLDGAFTDGGCHGNPGPGGWGAIIVKDNHLLGRRFGRDPHTTNNRMELMAIIAVYEMIGPQQEITIWSDSQLCVNTINLWAPKWEQRGWRRKGGAIKNLDLVQRLYGLAQTRPLAKLCWVKAHHGSRWNEYVDILATTY